MYAFDFRTRMLPYWFADKRMAPCSVRILGDCLDAAGFKHIRIVLQQWTPNIRPSMAILDGKPLDVLLVSAMQVHAEPAYDLIRDAHSLGPRRPLILVGGPKAIYEPTDFFELGPRPGVGADGVVTGEVVVLLELLEAVLHCRRAGDTARDAFERARRAGGIDRVPGLVYLHPDAPPRRPFAVNTGVQRLLRDLDELPLPDAGFRMLEPPHRRPELSPRPCNARTAGKYSSIAPLLTTQGCRFRCPFCPIPAFNQRTWRHKSPQRIAAEIKHIHDEFGIVKFFGTDDNFFNDRQVVIDTLTEMARTTTRGVPLAKRIAFYTEATQFDVVKNRDLLPLCRESGVRGLWFGIEDLTADLVAKGQTPDATADLFARLHRLGIEPHAMLIHSDAQPLRTPANTLNGLLNQTRYVFARGAVTYQCTYLGPAVGTRDFEPAAKARAIFRNVGKKPVPQAFQDGNHVAASLHPRPWTKQTNLLRAYMCFYNPINLLRALLAAPRGAVARKQVAMQIVGILGLTLTIPRMMHWARRLKRGPIEVWDGLQPARIPMVDPVSRQQVNWAIEHLPTPDLTGASAYAGEGVLTAMQPGAVAAAE